MPDNIPEHFENRGLNPQSMKLAELARILTLSGPKPVTVEMLRADISAGAPANVDGTMSLIQYAAWLARETKHAGD